MMKKTIWRALSLLLVLALCLPTALTVLAEGAKADGEGAVQNSTFSAEDYAALYVTDVDGDGVSDLRFLYDAFSHKAGDEAPTEIVDRFGNRASIVDSKSNPLPVIGNASYTEKGLYLGGKTLSLSELYAPFEDVYLEAVISQTGERVTSNGTVLVGPAKISIQMNQNLDADGNPVKNQYPIDESYGVVSGTYWSAISAEGEGIQTLELGTDVHWKTVHFLGGATNEIFTVGVAVEKDREASSASYLLSYTRDTSFVSQAKGGALYDLDADQKLEFGYGYYVNYHAVRLYSRIPTEEQLRQNHFADLATATKLDLTAFNALTQEEKALLYELCADISLSDQDVSEKLARAFEDVIIKLLYVRDANGDGTDDATLLWDAFGKKESDALSEKAFTVDSSASYGNGYLFNNEKEFNLNAFLPNISYGGETAQKDYTVELVMSAYEPESGTGPSWLASGSAWYFGNMKANFHFRQSQNSSIADGPLTASVPKYGFVPGSSILSGNLVELNKSGQNHLFATAPLEIFTSTLAFDLTLGDAPDKNKDTVQISLYRNAEKLQISALDSAIKYDASNKNDVLKVGLGIPLNFYAIRVYSACLTAEQMCRNHFADLIAYYRPENLALLAKLSGEGLQAVQSACEALTLGAVDAEERIRQVISDTYLEEKAEEEIYLAESFLCFEGYAMRMVGDRDWRITYSVKRDYIASLPAHASVLEMGVLVSEISADCGNEEMKKNALTLDYAAQNAHAEKNAFYSAESGQAPDALYHTVLRSGRAFEDYGREYLVRGYVKMSVRGEEVTLYENAVSERFGERISLFELSAALYGEDDDMLPGLTPELVLESALFDVDSLFDACEKQISAIMKVRSAAEKQLAQAKSRADELVAEIKALAAASAEADAAKKAELQARAAAILSETSELKEQALVSYPHQNGQLEAITAQLEYTSALIALSAELLASDEGESNRAEELIQSAVAELKRQRIGFSAQTMREKAEIADAVSLVERVCARIQGGEFGAVKTLKLLAVGNSFSQNALTQLYEIAAQFGYEEIVLGNVQYKDCSIEMHAKYAQGNQSQYTYVKQGSTVKRAYAATRLLDCLKDEDWDIITLQQVGHLAPQASTLTGDELNNLVSYVNRHKTNPDAKIYYHATWSFAEGHTHASRDKAGFEYLKDQTTMDRLIGECVESAILTRSDINGVIYAGAAMSATREYFGNGKALYSDDGYNLNEKGCYIVGLTWFGTLTGEDISTATSTSACGLSGADLTAAIDAAKAGIAAQSAE